MGSDLGLPDGNVDNVVHDHSDNDLPGLVTESDSDSDDDDTSSNSASALSLALASALATLMPNTEIPELKLV